MRKMLTLLGLAFFVVLMTGSFALAEQAQGQNAVPTVTAAPFYGPAIAAGLGAALTIIGAGYGFGKIGAAALDSMARQPEVADTVGRNMIVIAALLEGATFFSLIVCMLLLFKF